VFPEGQFVTSNQLSDIRDFAPPRRFAMTEWLSRLPSGLFGIYAGTVAFGVYFAMYAFRKPFAAAAFDHLSVLGIDYKIVLVIAQVVGYALAKLIGVKVIAELPANRRVIGILAQIALAEAALVLFGLIPAPWNAACLFVDGLALGMIWGMVFGFVEGRRQSELIAAILCASFILSSGVVKAVGASILLHGVSPFWMPAVTGALFVPPDPSPGDIAERVRRVPIDAAARAALLRRYALGLVCLIALYIMLTALRDFRDNFSAEIWQDAGLGGQPAIFAWTELPVSCVVLVALAGLMAFRGNRAALTANFVLMALGLVIVGGATLAFTLHALGPVAWMLLLGMGLYLSYTPFNGILFDRLVASSGTPGNAGFFIYVADTFGYGGTVLLLCTRDFFALRLAWTQFLVEVSLVTSALGLVLLGCSWVYFHRKLAA
jgi:hypothetical protein